MKKLAALTVETEQSDVETSGKIKDIEYKTFLENKTLIKNIECKAFPENCKPFIVASVLFLCITIILIGIMTYFCLKLKNNVLSY